MEVMEARMAQAKAYLFLLGFSGASKSARLLPLFSSLGNSAAISLSLYQRKALTITNRETEGAQRNN